VSTYLDSSALVAVYVTEAFSRAARRAIRADRAPVTGLHILELFNAFERLVGIGSITRKEQRMLVTQFREDAEAGRLQAYSLDLQKTFSDAHKLSLAHSAKLLTRSLDLLHVAAARLIGCTTFVSADGRQLALAKTLGLRVIDIARPLRRPK
jgi:predicted nucleic acid-binding protein